MGIRRPTLPRPNHVVCVDEVTQPVEPFLPRCPEAGPSQAQGTSRPSGTADGDGPLPPVLTDPGNAILENGCCCHVLPGKGNEEAEMGGEETRLGLSAADETLGPLVRSPQQEGLKKPGHTNSKSPTRGETDPSW